MAEIVKLWRLIVIAGIKLPIIALITAVIMINALNKQSWVLIRLKTAKLIATSAKHHGNVIKAQLAINKLLMINFRFLIDIA